MIHRLLAPLAILLSLGATLRAEPPVTHSFLACGAETYILQFEAPAPGAAAPEGKVLWSSPLSTREGWVLPDGNLLLAVSKGGPYPGGAALLVTRGGKTLLEFKGTQEEVNSVQPLPGGRVLLTEAGPRPRLLEIDRTGKIALEFPLACQKENAHMETRLARKLPGGTYLAPHLLDFAVKEYSSEGKFLRAINTAVEGKPDLHTWPFTAIRLAEGHTLIGCTHGNRIVETDREGKIVWHVSNEDLPGAPIQDACGVQRLPNGNTVFTSYAAKAGEAKLIEVTREKKIVWIHRDGKPHGIHAFQILDTCGVPLEGVPLR